MDDNQNKNQPNPTPSDYQKILDEYAASVKPEINEPTENIPEEKIPVDSLKETLSLPEEPKKIPAETTDKSLADELEEVIAQKKQPEPISVQSPLNSTQSESPIHPSLAVNLEENDTADQKPVDLPPISTPKIEKPLLETTPEPIVDQEPKTLQPEKTPEEIKAEINRLLTEDETKPSDSAAIPPKTSSSVGKIFFTIALILFLVVAAGLAYFLFLVPSNTAKNKTDNTSTSITPTISEINDDTNTDSNEGSCELNNKTYQIGESFQSADGCNTCSCSADGVIACTEKACTGTPTVTSATKSATVTSTTKTTITPTKVATPSIKLSPATNN